MALDLITAKDANENAKQFKKENINSIGNKLLHIVNKRIRNMSELGYLYTIQLIDENRWRQDEVDFIKFSLRHRQFSVRHIKIGIFNVFFNIPELLIIKWNNVGNE